MFIYTYICSMETVEHFINLGETFILLYQQLELGNRLFYNFITQFWK